MWHEARKQERKIRGMMVDYRRRAERRRDFYEKIKADPTQFLQLHARQCKIHLDPSVASAADSPATMMPWQGQRDNLIDRFDVRAHLDFIPFVKKEEDEEVTYEERQINYERYRIIAQNSFLCISEEKFLKQLHMEEQFGYTEPETKKKKGGATIGFNYEDGTAIAGSTGNVEEHSDDNSDSDLDVDLYINVSKVDQHQAHEMNKHGLNFGMSSNDFYSFLTDDMEEAENNRLAREEEHEKALFSGRKSRRERRAHREKRLANRVISPPSYAARSSPTYPHFRESKSPSRSPTPDNSGKITYITSFGEDEEAPTTSKLSYANKVKYGKKPNKPDEEVTARRVSLDKPKSGKWDRNYKRKRTSKSSSSRSPSPRRYSRSSKRRDHGRKSRRRSYSRSRNRSKKYRSRRSTSSSSTSTSSTSSSSSSSKSRSRRKQHSIRPHRKISNSSRSSSSSSSSRFHSELAIKNAKKSRSPSIKRESPPKPTVQRYYGRKRSDQSSSSDFEATSDKEKNSNITANQSPIEKKSANHGNAVSTFKKSVPVVTNMSLQERLKKKRQALLNKQFKADKLAEQLKSEREKQEQQNREDELREMAIKLRRRQREIRHAYDSHSSKSSSENEDAKGTSSVGLQKSRSDSPSDKHIKQEVNNYEESPIQGKSELKMVKEKTLQSSPKLYNDSESKNYYKEDNYRKKENKKDDYRRESDDYKSSRREKFRNRSSGSRSLVDY